MTTYKLTDTAIAQIAKCLQMAILTGTDVVDHLRQLEFISKDSKLNISKEYMENFEINIQKMTDNIQKNPLQQKLFE